MKTNPRILLIVAALLVPIFANAQVKLLRQPAYSNGKIAFSYLGDIWVANEDGSGVQRLTDNVAHEAYPRFSPDGKWIAFSSDREGNYDVYVMPADGGRPRQLTFNTASDIVVGWTPDGKKIIFTSSRNLGVFPSVTTLFEISADGGMEEPLQTDWGSSASYSPDGTKLAFSRHPGVWSRQHYRGSYAVDLWLEDLGSKKFTKLGDADYKGDYFWPMYGRDGEIYFVADRLPDEKNIKFGGPEVMKSANNIWKISEKGGKPVQVTHHTDGNLYFPGISADGKVIVYEDNFGLWKLDTSSGKSTGIPINIKSDTKENDVELRAITSEAEGFNLSPSTKRAAIVTHGEIFTVATDRGEPQRVTETFWREDSPHWSPDGKWIAFVSDRSGREEIWLSDELGHDVKQLTDAAGEKNSMAWSLDSKSLLWTATDSDHKHKLWRADIESGKSEELLSSDAGSIGSPQFSPDGKWISYSKQDKLLRSHVYVKPLDGGTERMIEGQDFLMSSGAKWTPDGKKLLIFGGVGAPAMSSLNRTVQQLYSVSLTRITNTPDSRDINTEAQAVAGSETNAPTRGGRGRGGRGAAASGERTNSTPAVEVKIEWDGIKRRIQKLTSMGGSVSAFAPSPDSRTIAFVASGGDSETGGGRPALYTIAEDGTRLTQISTATPPAATGGAPRGRGGFGGGGFGEPQWAKDGRIIYYLQGGGIYSVAVSPAPPDEGGAPAGGGGGRGGRGGRGGGFGGGAAAAAATSSSTPRRVAFTLRLEIDHASERRQVFEEAWRIMKDRFSDPNMHGTDWNAAKKTYEALLPYIADNEELHNVIMEMIGEINASHTGISGGDDGSGGNQERVQTRYPGFDIEPDSSGYYKVSYIYKDGPADHDYVNLSVGDFILSVNGKELKTSDNYWKLFNLAFGRKFEFRVNSKPQTEGAWTVSLEPLSSGAQANLAYDRWVDSRKAMVDKLSNGDIGYLHIRAMDAASLQKFQHDLLENLDKKALVIDERFNGGGGIDQELLEILNQQKKYESYRGRDSVLIPRPVQAFFGPKVVLQNERSASNAEMFPEGFRTLGLGKIVGVPTYGAVIGTGSARLLDGSTLRTPSIEVYTASGESFENYGVPPDVYVDNTPEDFLTGHDRQIEKAVEVLKSEIQK